MCDSKLSSAPNGEVEGLTYHSRCAIRSCLLSLMESSLIAARSDATPWYHSTMPTGNVLPVALTRHCTPSARPGTRPGKGRWLAFSVWMQFTVPTGKSSGLPRGISLVTRMQELPSGHVWDPMASSSVNFCRKRAPCT
jgi:hypothetical protein